MKKVIIWTILAAIILGLGILAGREAAAPTPEMTDETESEESDETVAEPEEEEITEDRSDLTDRTENLISNDSFIVNEQPAGSEVVVSDIDIVESRWIVVHEDRAGDLGNILGARLITPEQIEAEIGLLRSTEPDQRYFVVLYQVAERDEERGRVFDSQRDLPLVEPNGDLKVVEFRTFSDE